MADENDTADKTEDPTQKRLDDAHDRGDVVKSQEINTWFVIAGGTLVLSTFSGSVGGGILLPLRNLIANSWMIHADGASLLALAQSLGYALMGALGVPFLMLALAAIAGNMVQHRLVWSGESLKPKLSKISPGAGAKRIFGKQALAVLKPGQWSDLLDRLRKLDNPVVPTQPSRYAIPVPKNKRASRAHQGE